MGMQRSLELSVLSPKLLYSVQKDGVVFFLGWYASLRNPILSVMVFVVVVVVG